MRSIVVNGYWLFLLFASLLAIAPPAAGQVQASAGARAVGESGLEGNPSLHFLAGAAVGLSAAAILLNTQPASEIAHYPLYLPAAALYASAVAGIGKEALDSTGFGSAEFSDILTTLLGGSTAAAAVAYAQRVTPAGSASATNATAFLISTALLVSIPVAEGLVYEIERYLKRTAPSRAVSG